MDAEWVRWLAALSLGAIGYLLQRWIAAILERQKERDEGLRRELRRLAKNLHNHAEHLRALSLHSARVGERLDIEYEPPVSSHAEDETGKKG